MEKQKIIINVIDFTEYPGPRYISQGESSGEEFYHKLLNKNFYDACQKSAILSVDLDNTCGYASSFLDEAFGNLIFDFGEELVSQHLEIISNEEPEWIAMIQNETFKEWIERRKKGVSPKKTQEHADWYKFDNSSFSLGQWGKQ